MSSRFRSKLATRRTAAVLALAALAVAVFATIGSASSVTASQAQYAPVNTGAPTISGSAVENQLLTANDGSWCAPPTSFGYQWLQCDTAGNACVDIKTNATGRPTRSWPRTSARPSAFG